MPTEWICDGCGGHAPGVATQMGWRKPSEWFEKNVSVDADDHEVGPFQRGQSEERFKTILIACSRECIDRVASATGTHRVVLPI